MNRRRLSLAIFTQVCRGVYEGLTEAEGYHSRNAHESALFLKLSTAYAVMSVLLPMAIPIAIPLVSGGFIYVDAEGSAHRWRLEPSWLWDEAPWHWLISQV